MSRFLLFFVYQSFEGLQKDIGSGRHFLNFEDMENPLCTNSLFIIFLQNVQSRFWIWVKFNVFFFFFFDTNFISNFWAFLLKTDVLVQHFWTVLLYISHGCHFLNLWVISFHMISNVTIFRQNFVYTIYRKEGKFCPRWQAEVFILISLLLSPFDNSTYPKNFCTQVPPLNISCWKLYKV